MRTLNRKSEKNKQTKLDAHITNAKYEELKTKLDKLKNHSRPRLAKEVGRLAELGDFSENAEYQIAKGKLRFINREILKIENLLNHAQIIQVNKDSDTVQLGHFVTIEISNKQKTYQILGSTETNPQAGIISHSSPLGKALINKKVGDVVEVEVGGKIIRGRVVEIK